MKSYELIDHTADVGIRAFGKNLEELFRNVAVGMFEMMTDLEKVTLTVKRSIHLEEKNVEDLFIRWLQELLYRFSVDRVFYRDFEFKDLSEKKLSAVIRGEKMDEKKHVFKKEVKAVTYHELKVERSERGWVGEVIFDI